jgi:hypothetical protein
MYISIDDAKKVGPAVLSGPRTDHTRPNNPKPVERKQDAQNTNLKIPA